MTRIDPGVRRRRTLTAGALMLVLFGVAALDAISDRGQALRLVDIVRVTGIVALALVLALRSTTSFTIRARRPELDDELTQAHRGSAARWGFLLMMLGALGLYVGSFFAAIRLAEGILMLIVVGSAAATFTFIRLEARAERGV
jgi:hypothetical protein